jgi:protein-tyrosine phosphatase
MTQKLLFVCLGNICRSPAAEGIMNHLLEQAGLQNEIVCDSAGTSNYHLGASPDPRMRQAAKQQGIPLQGGARQFQPADFETFDLILAMDRQNYHNLVALDPQGHYGAKVRLICDFCTRHQVQEVPDPYYGGAEGFREVIDLLTDACQGLLLHLTEGQTLTQEQPQGQPL